MLKIYIIYNSHIYNILLYANINIYCLYLYISYIIPGILLYANMPAFRPLSRTRLKFSIFLDLPILLFCAAVSATLFAERVS